MANNRQWAKLMDRKDVLLAELAALGPLRRGSVTEQYVESIGTDGRKVRRGPYPLYTYKETGQKTISRRLTKAQDVTQYREQIQRFRRFQIIQAELLAIGEQLCASDAPEEQKKSAKLPAVKAGKSRN